MKKYQKAKMIAKNLPTGSYAAGCPAEEDAAHALGGWPHCKDCERTR